MDKIQIHPGNSLPEIIVPGINTVMITTARYEKLLKAEISLGIIEKMYNEDESFSYDTTLRKIFSKKVKAEEDTTNAE